MSTTCYIHNKINAPLDLRTDPFGSETWGSDTYKVNAISVGALKDASVVTLNRFEDIKADKTYYMKTEVKYADGNLICSLKEKLIGTWCTSHIYVEVESGDGNSSTGWIANDGQIEFTINGKRYQVQIHWDCPSLLQYYDVHYTLSTQR